MTKSMIQATTKSNTKFNRTTYKTPMHNDPAFDDIEETPVKIDALLDILSLVRVSNSAAEEYLIDHYIVPHNPEQDTYGNLFVTVGENPSVAFTAHTDTVHSAYDFNRYYVGKKGNKKVPTPRDVANNLERQAIGIRNNVAYLDSENDCLGADDGTGVWIMLNLIKAKVPGLYCFYRDEESGRVGSEWSAQHDKERYAGIDMMLSFDRKGTTDVITHQMGARCCSELFAEHISKAIDPDGHVAPDDGGSFTDSFSFIDMIPECTNICVGYYRQHTAFEEQDLTWAAYLVNRLIAIDWNIVPVAREPGKLNNEHLAIVDLVTEFPDDVAEILETHLGLTTLELATMIAELNFCTTDDVERLVEKGNQMFPIYEDWAK
ncbi:hypothetical protein [Halomonas sp. 707B3]|uniref:hypothetical protein n=1 Tax=Halomonas sp. 707B3 TaxID=1681043 RepID=UPI00209CDABD|nr:hypothetical protein [Halomonas sp. 707B3]MCP1316873.1 hypothetical protein [Halomonas sp. 707B3]